MSSDTLVTAAAVTKIYGVPRRSMFSSGRVVKPKRAIEGVSVEVRRGETIGILGQNGAGKSTLLALLGGAMLPTSGEVHRSGRTAVLLELGAGFDINFSGRDNARMFLQLAGTRRRDLKEAVSRISAYADIGEYFDLPLRTYSSGMHSRFAFACAINMEADLVIIDETLAVGDIEFRAKCYATIRKLQQQGRSFVLVTHNPGIVSRIATRAWVLDAGQKIFDGDPAEAARIYRKMLDGGAGLRSARSFGVTTGKLTIKVLEYRDEEINFEIEFCADRIHSNCEAEFTFSSHTGIVLAQYWNEDCGLSPISLEAGKRTTFRIRIENVFNQSTVILGVRLVEAGSTIAFQQIRLDIDKAGAVKGVADLGLHLRTLAPPCGLGALTEGVSIRD